MDLTTELESAKAQILAHKAQMESVCTSAVAQGLWFQEILIVVIVLMQLTEEMLAKVNNAVKERTLVQQEVDSVKAEATHAARDREQVSDTSTMLNNI